MERKVHLMNETFVRKKAVSFGEFGKIIAVAKESSIYFEVTKRLCTGF